MAFNVAETVLRVDSHTVESPIRVMDRPHRCLIVVLDDEPNTIRPPGSPLSAFELLEAIYYPGGTIRAFGPAFVDGPKRAVVVLLDESPQVPTTNITTADKPPIDPIQVGNLIIDLEDVNEIEDCGDHIYIGFSPEDQPPFLFLAGDKADEFRKLGMQVYRNPHAYLSEAELAHLEQKVAGQEPVEAKLVGRLMADVHALRNNRIETIQAAGRFLQMRLDGAERLVQMLANNQVHRVRCIRSAECQVNVDGSCTCEESKQS